MTVRTIKHNTRSVAGERASNATHPRLEFESALECALLPPTQIGPSHRQD
jgi:hypothetical protein